MNLRTFGAGVVLSLLPLFSTADAAYVVTFEQVGSDVVATGGGSINLTDLTFGAVGTISAAILPALGEETTGPASLTAVDEYVYPGLSGPPSFGPGPGVASADSGSGDLVGVSSTTSSGPENFGVIFVPDRYGSGGLLSDTSTYLNKTFANLGLTPGTYVYSWGTGADADTFTVQIGNVPEPSTWAMLLIGFGGLGYSAHRRRAGAFVKAV